MKKIAILLCFFGIIILSTSNLFSQCTNASSYGSAAAPTDGTIVQISTCNYQTEYSTVSGFVAGQTYVAGYDLGGYITVRSGSSSGPVVASGNAPLSFVATVSGTYYIHYNTNSGCGTDTDCGVSTIACSSCGASLMTVPSTGNNSYTTCGGNIYDFGGAAGDYGTSWDGYTVLNPDVAGNMVQVSGTIAGEACCDYLYIYDGVGTGGTLLWSGVTSSGTVPVTTSTTGSLTIRFTSDGSVVGAGFNLAINCVAGGGGMTVPSSGNNSYTTCGGNLYDFGGAAGDYGTSWDGYTVLNPNVAGNFVQVSGTIAGESCCDYLYIYDGVGTGGTLLWSGVTSSGTVPVTTSSTGSLTIRFTSDASIVGAGFNLAISCVASSGPCASITPMVCGTIYSGNLLALDGDWDSYTDCTWGAGDEVVYSFTPTTTGVHTLTGTAVSGDPDFFLMSTCGNTGTNIIGSCWGSGTQTPTLTAGTTYYFIVDNYSTSFTADYSISITCPNPLSTDCPSSAPFCTDNSYSFPAGVNQPDMGHIGCLYSTPNPAWYWMEIDNPGDIIINISSGADVDFIAWGPYPDLPTACTTVPITSCGTCPNNTTDPTFYPFGEIVDCSYSAAATETANIIGAQSGDVYVLLLTNYANVVTDISFVQGAGAGSTNCGIVAPPVTNNGPLCVGQTLELYVSNPTAGATYAWTGPDGWTSTDMNPTRPNVTTVMAGVYSLVITVAAVSSAPVTTTVVIDTYPTAGITNNTGTTVLTCTVTPINVTATGGGTYAWSGGATPATAANSFNAPGTYTITVTNGVCTDTESITITQNITPPTAGITNITGTTVLTCTTTTISVTATGGGTYVWSGGATAGTAANSFTTPATYTVTVTAANGCTDTESITITQNITPPIAGITNNTGTTLLTCTTTAISVTATGGGTYSWSGGATPATAANSLTTPGTYTVTVTAANGCTDTESITITQNITPPTAGITNNTGTTVLTCTTTAISVTATGGGTYAWSGGATPATAANSFTTPGTYTVTVTAANGCTDTEAITITQNITPPTAGITNNTGTTILTCTTTSISVTATGGGTYAWSGGATPATAANSLTTPGTYTVTVTAANGCTDTEAITITQNITPPSAGITNNTGTTVLTCATTAISVTATGGGTYAWSGGATPGTAANSFNAAGTYTVTVTAANGCTDTESITITQNITPPTAGITNNTGTTILTCTTLSISVTATGGGTYAWSGGATPGTAANSFTTPGTYTVTVTAANGCTDTEAITITQTVAPPTAAITNNTGTTILTCTTTAISVTATGGGTYAWSGGATPGTAANSLTTPGTYTVTVTAANGCTDTESITITQNITPPTAGITNNTGTTILTCTITAISVTATGGGTYSWSGGATPATAANSFNAAGTYTVTVTAANGCTDTESITITQDITPPTAGITNNTGTTILTCTTTAISVTATGGGTYSWSGGATPATAANSFNAAGTYTVTVTAANGCTDTEAITITVDNIPPVAGITNNTGSTIINCTTLAISVTATGGGTYAWSGGATPATAANSFNAAGTYTVTVTAANGCTDTESITITQDAVPPVAGITNNTGTTVLNCTVLSISVTATGGGTYAWSGGATPGTAANSFNAPGTYTVTVTAANGCTDTESITITQNITPPTAGITNNTGSTIITCTLLSIDVTATGGVTYIWSGGTSPNTANNLLTSAGTYTVTVTGANGCTAASSITLTDALTITASVTALTDQNCSTPGSATVQGADGIAPYTYSWPVGAGGVVGGTASALTAGSYIVSVYDSNMCSVTQSVTIVDVGGLTGSASVSATPLCFGGNGGAIDVSIIGGTPNYNINWGTGSFSSPLANYAITGLTQGTYNITVTDVNSCQVVVSATVNQPTLLTASSSASTILCNSGNSTVTVSAAGGTPAYAGTGTFTVTAGTHNYIVTDVNGCIANTSVTVTQPALLTASSSATAILCNGGNSTVTVAAAGGTPGYTGAGTFTVTAGTHNYTVTDANGCTANTSVTVSQPTLLTASSSATPILCNGGNSTVTVTGAGGTAPYSGTGTFTVTAGTHNYTVTDANGCTAATSVTVSQPAILTASSSATAILCNGGNSTVTVTAAGGTPAYSGTGTYTVTTGTHNYTVTDANGCTANTSVTVTQPTLLTSSSSATSILCNGGNSTVTVAAAGGTPAYSGTGTFTVTAGTHNYTVTDANGCTSNTSVTVSQPTLLTASSSATPILCNGGTSNVTVSGAGGTAPYSGTGTFTVTAGTHNYTVTDANGCTANTSVTVSQPTLLTASSSATPILCNGGTSTVTVLGAGGTAPYSGTGTFTVTAGTHNYTVTDANGCTANTSVTVSAPALLTASSSATAVMCNGGNSTVTVSAAGGTPAYSGTGTFTVTAGTHNYTVTDANGCTANTAVTVTQPTILTASSSATTILCNGGNSTVTVTAAGGTPAYTGTGTFTVIAGTHNYTVTDVNGCSANTSVTVIQPTAVTASVTAIAQQVCTVPGSATVQGANGTPPYTYAWPGSAGGVSGGSASALTVGSYTVSVYDANMCSVTQLVTINDIGGLTASAVMASQPSCFGGSNGTATVTISSGTAPYNIVWPTGSATAPASPYTITGLSQGSYNLTLTDVNGCQANTSVSILQPTLLTASSTSGNIMCNGGTTTVSVSGSGGTPAYSGVGTFTVPAGTYNYTITDLNGCTANTSITVTQPTLLTASSTSGNILCNGGTTTVTVSGSSGTPAYSGIGTFTVPAGTYNYTITDINGCTANTSITVGQPTLLTANAVAGTILCNGGTTTVNVTASGGTPAYSGTGTFTVGVGTHNYVVTDINGCTANASVTIAQPAVLNASSTATEILCNGNTSTVTVTATGGTGAYSGIGNFVESAGTYSYTVTDINGCQDVTTITINEPSWLTATATAGEILCFGGTASMNVVANGGTPPYSGTGTFPVIAGNYNYTITDDHGCITFASETVNQPDQLVVSETVTNALCNGYDGSATINIVSGGTLPCTILWEDGSTQFTNPNIPVNTAFEYTVTDDNGCQVIGDVSITEPAALVLTMNSTNASCYGLCDGTATVSIVGGTAPYITDWQPFVSGTTNINNLCAGSYFVTVTDVNGCEAISQVTITEPAMLQVIVATSPAQCGATGGSAFASIAGGTNPYTVTWSVPQITNPAIGLAPGNYTCYVSDFENCTASVDFTIDATGTINAAINLVQPVSCNGDSNGSLQAVSTNGVTPLQYTWNNDWHSATVSNLPAAQYSVIITDSWGCEGNANFNLPEPQAMVINSNITDVSCFGLSDGSIALAVLHGTSPYSYSWNVSGNSNLITDLPAGTYDVVVTDFGECTASGSYTVNQPDELIMTTSVNNISCYGYLDGAVLINAIGGNEPYTFRIFDGTTYATGAAFNNLSGGIYSVSTEDDNGCSKSAEVMILEPSEIQGSYIAHNPSCIGNNDGLIEISIMGGTAPYLFGWDGNFIDIPFISGLRDGDYDVVVTDANNCEFSFGNIIMNEEDVDCLRIPNAFSPNGDGPNDTWIIENLEIFSGAYVFVYNRWGQEIWVGRPGDEWDGNFNGKQVPVGTYLYVINLYNGTPPYTGTVTIVE